ncbi:MAG: hypothetical protein HOQ45_10720 [Nocardioidaceae bacterium]|nr:hypothetical protein [Nocardioidaceae bacterium]
MTDADDVLRARANLAAATARAAAAERRLQAVRRYHELHQLLRRFHLSRTSGGGVQLPHLLDAGTLSALRLKTVDWVSTGRVGLKPLWLGFISLGGECGILEFDAYLHGAWEMSERDHSVLEQVCWEYETFGSL